MAGCLKRRCGETMENHSFAKWKAYLWMGALGILLSGSYLWGALQLPFGRPAQPGAGLFPVVVGVILLMASLATIWEGLRMVRHANEVDFPAGTDLVRLSKLIVYLAGYFILLPLLGFPLASVIFCTFLIHALSDVSWLRCAVYAILMAASATYLFVHLLNVPLPRGILSI